MPASDGPDHQSAADSAGAAAASTPTLAALSSKNT